MACTPMIRVTVMWHHPTPKNRLYIVLRASSKNWPQFWSVIYIYAWFSPRYLRCLRQIFEYSDVFIVFLGEGNKRSDISGMRALYQIESNRSLEVLVAYLTTSSLASYCWWRNPCTTWDTWIPIYKMEKTCLSVLPSNLSPAVSEPNITFPSRK